MEPVTTARGEAPGEAGSAPPSLETYHYSAGSLKTQEDDLFQLVQLSDIPMNKQLFEVVVELLRLNISPSAILHILKVLKAQATQTTMPPSLQASRASSRAHTPPPVQIGSTRAQEPHKPAHRASHASSSATKQASSQLPGEVDKPSRKHRHGSSKSSRTDSSGQKSSSRSSEKARSSSRGSGGGGGGGGGGGKGKGQTQDASKKSGVS